MACRLRLGLLLSFVWAHQANAEVCEYRLSQLASPTVASAALTVGSVVSTAGPGAMVAGGLYFFPHATAGTLMLGSTLAGASGAGTIGIIGGSGFAASVLAVLTAPATLLAAAGTTVAVGGLEVGCYFVDERITDEKEVLNVLRKVTLTADERSFKLFELELDDAGENGKVGVVRIPDGEGQYQLYMVANLYIVNGELLHRDWFFNTSLGNIAAAVALEAQP